MTPLQSKLKKAREKLDLTQEAMAAALGVRFKTYVNWEQDRTTPQGLGLKALNDAVDALLAGGK